MAHRRFPAKKPLTDRVALITGAGSGFGRAIAHRLAAEGAKVIVLDLDASRAAQVADEIGNQQALAAAADVTIRSDIDRAIETCLTVFGTPDIVINNAGFTHVNSSMLDVSEEMFDRVFAVNVKSIYHMAQATVPLMQANGGGSIINIGSTAGIRPRPGLCWYNASKGAVNLLSKSMAVELAPWGIRVNAICPVIGLTAMTGDLMGQENNAENRAPFIKTIPLGRFCEPEDVAEAAAYLAIATFITGVELPVDGGRTV